MQKKILYAAALDAQGALIRVADAIKGSVFTCPVCSERLILKKSERTGKSTRRPHFSHLRLTSNCTPEGVLHCSFKKLLVAHLERHLTENRPLEFAWACSGCKSKMSGDLLRHAAKVKEEFDLSSCRPDIALLDRNENVIAAIEVVVTHAPEDKVIHFYKERSIVLLQINLSSDNDLNEVEARVSRPDSVDYCMNRVCSSYSASTIKRAIQAARTSCGRCHSPLETYWVLVSSLFGEQSSLSFSNTEIDALKARPNRITVIKDPGTHEPRPVFTCENCERLAYMYGRRSPRL